MRRRRYVVTAHPLWSEVAAGRRTLASDVRRGLLGVPKRLASKYLYDALGSRLFEAICELPWYRIPEAERRLLAQHAPLVTQALTDPVTIVELGCGTGVKLAAIIEPLESADRSASVQLIDISPIALQATARTLAPVRGLSVFSHETTYEEGLRRVAAGRRSKGTMLALFLGSNIGNFDPPDAEGFLGGIRDALRPGDLLLLGADLVKPESELLLAYDDPLGLTAAFNKNLLVRLNHELRADFDLRAFDHLAVWDGAASRIEMHLASRRPQHVRIPAADCHVAFEAGETIWTESSYKFQPEGIVAMGRAARFRCREFWVEPDARFSLTLFVAV